MTSDRPIAEEMDPAVGMVGGFVASGSSTSAGAMAAIVVDDTDSLFEAESDETGEEKRTEG